MHKVDLYTNIKSNEKGKKKDRNIFRNQAFLASLVRAISSRCRYKASYNDSYILSYRLSSIRFDILRYFPKKV